MGKGGGEGQPFSVASRDWLRSQILGKTIQCQLLRREGLYGRMVSLLLGRALHPKLEQNQIVLAFLPRRLLPWWLAGNRGTNLSEESVRRGWAFIYESGSGEFPHPEKREGYMKLMGEAQYVTELVCTLTTYNILPTRKKESESRDVEERNLFGDARAVQEANKARCCIRDYRRHCGGKRGRGNMVSTEVEACIRATLARICM